jgi:hypothetical protein
VTDYKNTAFQVDYNGEAGTDGNNHFVGQEILRYIGASAFSIDSIC